MAIMQNCVRPGYLFLLLVLDRGHFLRELGVAQGAVVQPVVHQAREVHQVEGLAQFFDGAFGRLLEGLEERELRHFLAQQLRHRLRDHELDVEHQVRHEHLVMAAYHSSGQLGVRFSLDEVFDEQLLDGAGGRERISEGFCDAGQLLEQLAEADSLGFDFFLLQLFDQVQFLDQGVGHAVEVLSVLRDEFAVFVGELDPGANDALLDYGQLLGIECEAVFVVEHQADGDGEPEFAGLEAEEVVDKAGQHRVLSEGQVEGHFALPALQVDQRAELDEMVDVGHVDCEGREAVVDALDRKVDLFVLEVVRLDRDHEPRRVVFAALRLRLKVYRLEEVVAELVLFHLLLQLVRVHLQRQVVVEGQQLSLQLDFFQRDREQQRGRVLLVLTPLAELEHAAAALQLLLVFVAPRGLRGVHQEDWASLVRYALSQQDVLGPVSEYLEDCFFVLQRVAADADDSHFDQVVRLAVLGVVPLEGVRLRLGLLVEAGAVVASDFLEELVVEQRRQLLRVEQLGVGPAARAQTRAAFLLQLFAPDLGLRQEYALAVLHDPVRVHSSRDDRLGERIGDDDCRVLEVVPGPADPLR